MSRLNIACKSLVVIGLGGALLSSAFLTGATLLIAIAGIVLMHRHTLEKAGWEEPKELRLIHFAFWFFVVCSAVAWTTSDFGYDGFKAFVSDARFILFWPLVIALSYSGLRADTVFIAFGITALSALVSVSINFAGSTQPLSSYLESRVGGGINPIMFGHLALLGGALALVGGLYFRHQPGSQLKTFALTTAGLTGLIVASLAQTRSNLIALPVMLLVITSLLTPRLRLASIFAVASIALIAAITGDRAQTLLDVLVAVPRELLDLLTTSGISGLISWGFLLGIPLFIFSRHITSQHEATAHLAVAGTLAPLAYLLFGLTEAPIDHPLYMTFYLLLVATFSSALFAELRASCFRPRSVKVSATVITMNEAHHIADCLISARLVADEIIVLDSGSTDNTVEIARQYADIVEVTDWPGFGVQKQRALAKATGEWVLSIDADERITDELAQEINHHLADPDADAYKLPWAVTIYGKRLDFGRSGRAPLRLFRREGVRFSDALVHEKIMIPEGRKTRTLRGRLTHYTHRDFGHSLEKSSKYAWLGAQEKFRQGKKTRTMLYPTVRGLLTFIQVYFIRFGFLDGAVGYLTAATYAQVTFNKYAGLWTLGKPDPIERNT